MKRLDQWAQMVWLGKDFSEVSPPRTRGLGPALRRFAKLAGEDDPDIPQTPQSIRDATAQLVLAGSTKPEYAKVAVRDAVERLIAMRRVMPAVSKADAVHIRQGRVAAAPPAEMGVRVIKPPSLAGDDGGSCGRGAKCNCGCSGKGLGCIPCMAVGLLGACVGSGSLDHEPYPSGIGGFDLFKDLGHINIAKFLDRATDKVPIINDIAKAIPKISPASFARDPMTAIAGLAPFILAAATGNPGPLLMLGGKGGQLLATATGNTGAPGATNPLQALFGGGSQPTGERKILPGGVVETAQAPQQANPLAAILAALGQPAAAPAPAAPVNPLAALLAALGQPQPAPAAPVQTPQQNAIASLLALISGGGQPGATPVATVAPTNPLTALLQSLGIGPPSAAQQQAQYDAANLALQQQNLRAWEAQQAAKNAPLAPVSSFDAIMAEQARRNALFAQQQAALNSPFVKLSPYNPGAFTVPTERNPFPGGAFAAGSA